MSVNNDTALTGPYYPNGATTVFPFSFISSSVAEVDVVIDDTVVDRSDYIVTRDDSGSGYVTFAAAPTSGTLYVVSSPIFLETINFDRFGAFFPDFVNTPIWREAVRSIYLKGQTDRALKVPIGETPPAFPSIDDAEGLVVGVSGGVLAMLPQLPGPTGAPGGNTTAVGLWTEVIAGMNLTTLIASGAKRFWTSGYGSTARGAASYRILASVADAADYNELSATGVGHYSRHGQNIWWYQLDATHRAALSVERPSAEMFGAVADAAYNYSAGVWSGTDNQPAIQAMLDYGTYCAHCAVYLNSGAYLIGKSLHAGYGEQYVSTKLFGQGSSYGGVLFPGTALVHNFSQGMGINYQGQRRGYCVGIEFVGPLFKYLVDNNFCSVGAPPSVDDTVGANWIDPSLWVGAGNTHSPCAAVTVDAYSGAQPAGTDPITGLTYTRYPDVTYPAASGIVAQFNKALSSVIYVEGSNRGHAVGVCVQPGDSDGNGDFVQVSSWNCEYSQYFISVGQTQSRSVRVDYVAIGTIWCAMTSNRHGRRNGQFGGELRHFSASGMMRLMEIGSTSIVGSLNFVNTYIEAGWQLGTCNGASSVEVPITFSNIKASFSLQDLAGRGVPAFLWGHPTSAAGTSVPVTFDGGNLSEMPYVADFRGTNVRMNNVLITPTRTGASIGTLPRFMAFAHNACLGWSCSSLSSKGQGHRVFSQPRDLGAGTMGGGGLVRMTDGCNGMGYRDVGTPFWMSSVQPKIENDNDPVNHPQRTGFLTPTGVSLTSDLTSLAGDADPIRLRLEGTIPTLAADPSILYSGVAGSVWRERSTGTLFAVYSYNSATGAFKARILSNYRLVGGVYQLYDSTNWVLGTVDFHCYYSGWSTPIRALYGDFTSGSAAVINLNRLDGSAATAAEIVNGDAVVVNPDREYHLLSANAGITALNLGAKTMSLTGTGAAATVTKQRIKGIVRQPPANL